jgi:hypothetical protein
VVASGPDRTTTNSPVMLGRTGTTYFAGTWRTSKPILNVASLSLTSEMRPYFDSYWPDFQPGSRKTGLVPMICAFRRPRGSPGTANQATTKDQAHEYRVARDREMNIRGFKAGDGGRMTGCDMLGGKGVDGVKG